MLASCYVGQAADAGALLKMSDSSRSICPPVPTPMIARLSAPAQGGDWNERVVRDQHSGTGGGAAADHRRL
jgi:hypothetical protein